MKIVQDFLNNNNKKYNKKFIKTEGTMEKIFTTKNGTDLFFDEDNYNYQTNDVQDVVNCLQEDIDNYKVDINAAIMAHNILTIMRDIDQRNHIQNYWNC